VHVFCNTSLADGAAHLFVDDAGVVAPAVFIPDLVSI